MLLKALLFSTFRIRISIGSTKDERHERRVHSRDHRSNERECTEEGNNETEEMKQAKRRWEFRGRIDSSGGLVHET